MLWNSNISKNVVRKKNIGRRYINKNCPRKAWLGPAEKSPITC